MSGKGIPLDKVELLSVLLEGILYGFSLLMFGGTIWALLSQRSVGHVNRKIFTAACLLLLFSTVHLVLNIIRLMEGFVLYRDTYPGGPVGYFANVSQWTFVYRFYVFTAQTLLGDGVVLYRCYVVWQSKLVMILPALLWCAVGVFGIGSPYIASHVQQDELVFGASSWRVLVWITLFWASALATNALATVLLAYRIWYVDRKATRIHGPGTSQLRPMLYIIIDAGVIYSIALLVALIAFSRRTDFEYGMITPIITIAFEMVIIRVALANRTKQSINLPLECTSTDGTDPRLGIQVHVMTMTDGKTDNSHPSSMTRFDSEHDQSEDKPNYVGEVV